MSSAWGELIATLKKTTSPVRLLVISSRDSGEAFNKRMCSLMYWICSPVASCAARIMYGVGATVDKADNRAKDVELGADALGLAESDSIRRGCVALASLLVLDSGCRLAKR